MVNKTDKLDARGLNKLQRIGTLPEVWIPPGKLRDRRELTRTRMVLAAQRTQFKNRIHSTLDKYGLKVEVSDLFGKKGRALLARRLPELPPHTRQVTEIMLSQIDLLEERIGAIEERMREVLLPTRGERLGSCGGRTRSCVRHLLFSPRRSSTGHRRDDIVHR